LNGRRPIRQPLKKFSIDKVVQISNFGKAFRQSVDIKDIIEEFSGNRLPSEMGAPTNTSLRREKNGGSNSNNEPGACDGARQGWQIPYF
jgi:hypothetical protein